MRHLANPMVKQREIRPRGRSGGGARRGTVPLLRRRERRDARRRAEASAPLGSDGAASSPAAPAAGRDVTSLNGCR